MINTLKGKLGEADSEISQLAEGIVEKVKEKYGSYDPESLKEILTPILEKILGDEAALGELGDLGNLDFDKALAQNAMARELTADYIRDKNADILESGDVQVVDVNNIFDEMSRSDSEEFPHVAYVLQSNYTEDEEHQLHYLCESEDLIQLTLHEEEDGSLTVSDTQIVEEEDYEAFLQDLCKNGYKTAEDCLDSIEYGKACFPYVLSDYLEEHQEYTGIEYDGEMHTAEELDEIAAEHEAALYPEEAALYLQEAESDAQ